MPGVDSVHCHVFHLPSPRKTDLASSVVIFHLSITGLHLFGVAVTISGGAYYSYVEYTTKHGPGKAGLSQGQQQRDLPRYAPLPGEAGDPDMVDGTVQREERTPSQCPDGIRRSLMGRIRALPSTIRVPWSDSPRGSDTYQLLSAHPA